VRSCAAERALYFRSRKGEVIRSVTPLDPHAFKIGRGAWRSSTSPQRRIIADIILIEAAGLRPRNTNHATAPSCPRLRLITFPWLCPQPTSPTGAENCRSSEQHGRLSGVVTIGKNRTVRVRREHQSLRDPALGLRRAQDSVYTSEVAASLHSGHRFPGPLRHRPDAGHRYTVELKPNGIDKRPQLAESVHSRQRIDVS